MRIFLAIYEQRSVSRAGLQLEISQPTISAALRKLRTELGDMLFVRTSQGMQPTPAADRIAAAVRGAIDTIDRSLVKEQFDPSSTRDEFKVLTGDILESPAMMSLYRIIEQHAPLATCRSIPLSNENIADPLESGEIDLAMGYFPKVSSANVYTALIGNFTFRLFCREGHPLVGKRLTTAEFCTLPQLALEPACSITRFLEDWLLSQGIVRQAVVRTAHLSSIMPLLRNTDLVAVLPTNFNGAWFYPGEAELIDVDFEMPVSELRAYWHRTMQEDARHTWWRNAILRQMRQGARAAMDVNSTEQVRTLFRPPTMQ